MPRRPQLPNAPTSRDTPSPDGEVAALADPRTSGIGLAVGVVLVGLAFSLAIWTLLTHAGPTDVHLPDQVGGVAQSAPPPTNTAPKLVTDDG